ncbi:transposase [Streptomyces sp. NBC_01451]|uniref:transposase n=1 Tax=Streptomyces sp. NBC_01451 TaxID=2903872 RepID=UPI003FCD9293
MSTRPWIVDDDLWALIAPLLPLWPEKSPGPRSVADRLCLQGILFVVHNDIAWQLPPPELRFGSGQTCWRRLEGWQRAGVFEQLHRILLAQLNAAGELYWSRARVDGSHIRAKLRGADTGPSPVDRRKTGSKDLPGPLQGVRGHLPSEEGRAAGCGRQISVGAGAYAVVRRVRRSTGGRCW